MKILIIGITIIGTLLYAQQSSAEKVGLYMKGTVLQQLSEADERLDSGRDDSDANAFRGDFSLSTQFMGYVIGIVDASLIFGRLCMPKEVTRGQLMAIVSKYLKNNPEKWNNAGVELVLDALTPVFPCKKK